MMRAMTTGILEGLYARKGNPRRQRNPSLVHHPAGMASFVVPPETGRVFASRAREWDADEAYKRIRRWAQNGGDFGSCFLFYDGKDGAYKLPYCDIIQGEPVIIPRALSAAKARLNQTRGMTSAQRRDVLDIIRRLENRR